MPCPETPNCICSQSEKTHQSYVEPIITQYCSEPSQLMAIVKKCILQYKRTKIIQETNNYFWVECRTLLGWTDDLEIYFKAKEGILHIRSSSRTGYYDFRKNQYRYLALKKAILNTIKKGW